MKKIAYVGVDYHTKTLMIAVKEKNETDFYKTTRIKNCDKQIKKYMENYKAPHVRQTLIKRNQIKNI